MKWNYAIRRLFRRGRIRDPLEVLEEAADFIENNPNQYRFMCLSIPEDIFCSACFLGWIGYFAGYKEEPNKDMLLKVAKDLGFLDTSSFYRILHCYKVDTHTSDISNIVYNIRQYIKDQRGE